MKKILISIISVIVISILACTMKDLIVIDSEANDERFIKIYNEDSFIVFYDKNTNVEYIKFGGFKAGGGITPLIDKDGKPLLYEDK